MEMKKTISLLLLLSVFIVTMPVTMIYATDSDKDTVVFNGHRYARIEQSMTWKEAKQ